MPVDYDEPALFDSVYAAESADEWIPPSNMNQDILPNDAVGEDSFLDFMSSIEQNVMQMMKESVKAPDNAWDHWSAFSSAVDWQENWIRGLIAFHVVLLSLVIITRSDINLQTIIFMMICIMVMLSERLNAFCAEHWALFSKQNYFDEHGVFAGILYAGPLLLICLFQLLNFLGLASSALIKVKRMELKRKCNSKQHTHDAQNMCSSSSEGSAAE